MRGPFVVLALVSILVGTSGCLGLPGDQSQSSGLEKDRGGDPGERSEGDGDANGTSEGGQSDLSWGTTVVYDYARNPGSAGMASVDVPKEASEMTVTAEFQYWPPVAQSPGICSSDTELVIEVEGPEGEPFLNNTFDEDLEEGTEGETCGQIEASYADSPVPGEWTVSFTGEGVAVGKVSFQGS